MALHPVFKRWRSFVSDSDPAAVVVWMPKSLARSALLRSEDARSAGAGAGAGVMPGAGRTADAISTSGGGGGGGGEVVAISFSSILPSFLPSFLPSLRRAFYSFCGVESSCNADVKKRRE